MIPLSHMSFVQCDQVNLQPKKNVKIKVSHSIVAVGRVVVGDTETERETERQRESRPSPVVREVVGWCDGVG